MLEHTIEDTPQSASLLYRCMEQFMPTTPPRASNW